MKNTYAFYKSLVPGDVITSSGCKGVAKKNEAILTKNRDHHSGWGKYARVTNVTPELRCDSSKDDVGRVIGICWEGIDPSVSDPFIHVAAESDKTPVALRKTSKSERKVFMEEYLKTRISVTDHMLQEAKEVVTRMKRQSRNLSKIAQEENIDTNKLLKME